MRSELLASVERALTLVEPYRAPPAAPAPIRTALRGAIEDVPPARGALRRELQP